MIRSPRQTPDGAQFPFLRSPAGRTAFFLLLLFLLAFLSAAALRTGMFPVSFSEIFAILRHPEQESMAARVLLDLRLPRLVLGILTGSSLAVSGAILQGVMRNPLASPGILGISAGGGLAGTVMLLFFPALTSFFLPAAFAGAMLTSGVVCLIAWKRGMDPVRLILAGAAVSALLGSLSTLLLLRHPDRAGSVLDFLIGSLAMKSWDSVVSVYPYTLAGLAASFLFSGRLNLLELGDESAAGLGLAVERTRILLLAAASLLAAAAVSSAGLLGAVGLISPHIVRLCIGTENRVLLPCSAVFGAGLVVLCDTLGRTAGGAAELPAGVILSLIGPLFFLWLLRRSSHED